MSANEAGKAKEKGKKAASKESRSLSIEKVKILDQIGKKSYRLLSEEYGIGVSTISDIKKKGTELREYKRRLSEMGCKRPVKTMKMGKDQELDSAVFVWFKQKREEGIPITGPILKAKAIQLCKQLHEARKDGDPVKEFQASDGWLWRFSRRHGIRQLTLQGEKLSADKPAAANFMTLFQAFIEENKYTLSQIFNCDETGLYFKLLPQKTLASSLEKSADGRKTQKERVTINACSNVLGTIKLPLLLIGKYKNPRCFKHIRQDTLPVIYRNQSNAWVDASIFAEWFHQSFVPIVRRELTKLGIEPREVLVLDNCSAHPDEDELKSSDGKFVAKFLPPNVTSLIQPMDQGVLESLKRRYRRKILEELVLKDDVGTPIPDYLKSINMLVVSNLIAACWNEIPAKTLQLSWRKILANKAVSADVSQEPCESSSVEEFTSTFKKLGHTLTDNEVRDWLASDEHDPGYVHLSDEEIVATIIEQSTVQDSEDSEDSDSSDDTTRVTLSHSSAVKMFDGCLQWLQGQEEACVYNSSVLRELRELAARKRIGALKQKKVSDYFTTESTGDNDC